MFEIGFWELVLIGVIALLVLGPERLPQVARTAGAWLGKARRMAASVKADIDRELAAEELKRSLQKQMESAGLHEIIEETKETASTAEQLLKTSAPEPVKSPTATQAPPATQLPESKHGGD